MKLSKSESISIPESHDVFKDVEDFIQHWKNGDYVIDPSCGKKIFNHYPLIEGGRKESSLSDLEPIPVDLLHAM